MSATSLFNSVNLFFVAAGILVYVACTFFLCEWYPALTYSSRNRKQLSMEECTLAWFYKLRTAAGQLDCCVFVFLVNC